MNKLVKILLLFVLTISVCACSSQKEDDGLNINIIEWNNDNNIGDLVSFKVEAIDATKKIIPDVIGDSYTYYSPSDDNNYLIDLTLWMNNLTDQDIHLEKSFTTLFICEQTNYKAAILSVNQDGTSLSDSDVLEANSAKKVHFYFEADQETLTKAMSFQISTIEDEDKDEPIEQAVLDFEIGQTNDNYEVKNIGDIISYDSYLQINLQAVNITKTLVPASPTGIYNTYATQNETSSLVDVVTAIQNVSGNDLNAASLITATLIDKNNNSYPATVVYEDDNHTNLDNGANKTLNHETSAIIHYVFEVGDDVVNESKVLRVAYQGKVYLVNL